MTAKGVKGPASQARGAAVRERRHAFEPIGVMDDPEWPREEYDLYVPHKLRLLMDKAGSLAMADDSKWRGLGANVVANRQRQRTEDRGRLQQGFENEERGSRQAAFLHQASNLIC